MRDLLGSLADGLEGTAFSLCQSCVNTHRQTANQKGCFGGLRRLE